MSPPISFGDDGKVYGLLYPMGALEKPCWQIGFYSTERGRRTGITYLHKLLGIHCPILRFELTLSEIRERGVLAPSIPKDHTGGLEQVINPKWQHIGDKRLKLKDN